MPSPSFLVKCLCFCTTSSDSQILKQLLILLEQFLLCSYHPCAGGCSAAGCLLLLSPHLPFSSPRPPCHRIPPPSSSICCGHLLQSPSRFGCCPRLLLSHRSSLCPSVSPKFPVCLQLSTKSSPADPSPATQTRAEDRASPRSVARCLSARPRQGAAGVFFPTVQALRTRRWQGQKMAPRHRAVKLLCQ